MGFQNFVVSNKIHPKKKLAKKFVHPFSHLFVFGNLCAHGQDFDVVMVTTSKYFVFFPKLYRDKNKKSFNLIRWFLAATSGTKPIIVSAGQVYILLHQREK